MDVEGSKEGLISFFGQPLQQNGLSPMAISRLINETQLTRIIELGTGFGGLSILLALVGLEFITYDINDIRKNRPLFDALNIDFRKADVFERIDEIKELIQKPGKTLLICDGGNKPKEFKTFAPFLKPDDIIIAHDYRYDPDTWSWSEIDDDVLQGSTDIQKFNMDLMGPAAWLCCKKGNSINIDDSVKIKRPIQVYVSICTIRNPEVTQQASIQGTWFINSDDVKVIVTYEYGDAEISRSRSIVATQFMDKSHGDMLFFIDDDILYDPKDIVRIAKEAKELNAIVCGPYRIKSTQDIRLALHPLESSGEIPVGEEIGRLIEVRYASAGFMCIPRTIIEDVASTLPRVDSARGVDEEGTPKLTFFPMFAPFWPEGQYLSEDYAFAHRARELGYKCYIDSKVVLGHVGKVVFLPGEVRSILS